MWTMKLCAAAAAAAAAGPALLSCYEAELVAISLARLQAAEFILHFHSR